MRLVIDTNVLVNAGLKVDSTPRLAVRWLARHAVLLKSAETEAELRRTLSYPKLQRLLARGGFVAGLLEMIDAAELVAVVLPVRACRDEDDDKFLGLALSGGAGMIVSGDDDLPVLHPFRGVAILSPAALVRLGYSWP